MRFIRSLVPALPAAVLLSGCMVDSVRHVVQSELPAYGDARVRAVRTVDGNLIVFGGTGRLSGGRGGSVIGDTAGVGVIVPARTIAEAEIVVERPSVPNTWAISSVVVGAGFFALLLVIFSNWH